MNTETYLDITYRLNQHFLGKITSSILNISFSLEGNELNILIHTITPFDENTIHSIKSGLEKEFSEYTLNVISKTLRKEEFNLYEFESLANIIFERAEL
jgi:hypothetical protein